MNEAAPAVTAERTAGLRAGSIGLFGTTSSTLANIAPALTVFLTIPAIVLAMGTMAPWAFVLAAVAILATGNSLIEFARRMPSAGGFISYITRASSAGRGGQTGTFLGAMTFYLLLFIYPISVGSVVVFIGNWTASYAGWPAGSWIWITLAAMAISLPFLIRGTSVSVTTAFVLFLTEAAALLVLSVIVLVRAHAALAAPFHAVGGSPGGFDGLGGLTFGLAVFGYVGWENSAPLGEESRDPRRTVPRTVVLSIAVVMVASRPAGRGHRPGHCGAVSWAGRTPALTRLPGSDATCRPPAQSTQASRISLAVSSDPGIGCRNDLDRTRRRALRGLSGAPQRPRTGHAPRLARLAPGHAAAQMCGPGC